MPSIFPVADSRVTDALLTRRLTSELQFNDQHLLRIQTQISSGRQYTVASEDPSSALRALSLQHLLEQKQQIHTNLQSGQSYLSATDNTLGGVHGILAEARGIAVAAVGETASDEQRKSASQQVDRALEQLVNTGNRIFRGRSLFSGSLTQITPFEYRDQFVQYNGNHRSIRSFSDINLLFETNLNGDDVFGAVSPQVLGSADLSPRLNDQTRLSDLRGGQGITPGSIEVSDGSSTSTIDIRAAETVGDLVQLMEANPPLGRTITVDITSTGLIVNIDSAGGGNLTVQEVGGGHTAIELGILDTTGTGTQPIVGQDLNPHLRLTTRLDDILGARAETRLVSAGTDNDLFIAARDRGTQLNGTTVQFVNDSLLQAAPGLLAGNETVSYTTAAIAARASLALSGPDNDLILTAVTPGSSMNGVTVLLDASINLGDNAIVAFDPVANVLSVQIDDTNETTLGTLVGAIDATGVFTAASDNSAGEGFNPAGAVNSADAGVIGGTTDGGADPGSLLIHISPGNTTANDVIAAIAADPQVSLLFDAQLDLLDNVLPSLVGTGTVNVTATGTMSGGSGIEFDQSTGIQIFNSGQTYVVTFETAETVEDMLNIINGAGAGVLAEINDDATGINLRSRLSGGDFSVGENGGSTAADLGIRSLTTDTLLSTLKHDFGVNTISGTDFTIRRSDGVDLDIDVSTAVTIGDVLDLINNHPLNLIPASAVSAELTAFGNGIALLEDNPSVIDTLTITLAFGSNAARDLGLIAANADQTTLNQVAAPSSATIGLPPPNSINTGFILTANTSGRALNGISVIVTGGLAGDVANVTFDSVASQLQIDIDPTLTTANTIIAAIAGEGTFSAALDTVTDPTNDGTGIFNASGVLTTTTGGTADAILGSDPHPQETKGVFNALIRLRDALLVYDLPQIERSVKELDDAMERVRSAQAESGARIQGLQSIQAQLDDEEIELRRALSQELDVDLVEAISNLTSRQIAFEASLRSMGMIFQLSLLNFI